MKESSNLIIRQLEQIRRPFVSKDATRGESGEGENITEERAGRDLSALFTDVWVMETKSQGNGLTGRRANGRSLKRR